MPYQCRGKPSSTSKVELPDDRTATLVSRKPKHRCGVRDGYPLAEEFLDQLEEENVDTVAIDDGDAVYVFDRYEYRTGARVGHEPYPMKRVLPLEGAQRLSRRELGLADPEEEWEWVTPDDLQPVPNAGVQSASD